MSRLASSAVCAVIRSYQLLVSPLLGPGCRFIPSCSEYARQAVAHHGVFPGLWLGVQRLLRCQPLHPGGYDPVPTATTTVRARATSRHGHVTADRGSLRDR